jgi:hypothetical protein
VRRAAQLQALACYHTARCAASAARRRCRSWCAPRHGAHTSSAQQEERRLAVRCHVRKAWAPPAPKASPQSSLPLRVHSASRACFDALAHRAQLLCDRYAFAAVDAALLNVEC